MSARVMLIRRAEMIGQMGDSQPEAKRIPASSRELRRMIGATGFLGLIASLVGVFGWDLRVASGVFVGSLLAVGNLWIFGLLVRGILSENRSARVLCGLLAATKFVGLLFCVGLLLRLHIVDAIPLTIGYGSLPAGISLAGLFLSRSAADLIEDGNANELSNASEQPQHAEKPSADRGAECSVECGAECGAKCSAECGAESGAESGAMTDAEPIAEELSTRNA